MDVKFHGVAYIGDKEYTTNGTLKECSEWADKMIVSHAKELKEIKLEVIKDEKEK